MSSKFADLRTALAAEMVAVMPVGTRVDAAWPDELKPPCVFLTPPFTRDWATYGPGFNEWTLAVDMVLLVDNAAGGTAALVELETLVQTALVNVGADWILIGTDAPVPTTVTEGGAEYLATVIHLSKPVRLT